MPHRNHPLSRRSSFSVFFFSQGSFSFNNDDFRHWSIILTSSSGVWWYLFANKMPFVNMLSEMDEQNSRISNFMKMYSFLLSIPLNHSITVLEFFHWLTSRCFIKAWLIFSNLTLLTFLSSLFEGLIRLEVKLAWKFSL